MFVQHMGGLSPTSGGLFLFTAPSVIRVFEKKALHSTKVYQCTLSGTYDPFLISNQWIIMGMTFNCLQQHRVMFLQHPGLVQSVILKTHEAKFVQTFAWEKLESHVVVLRNT